MESRIPEEELPEASDPVREGYNGNSGLDTTTIQDDAGIYSDDDVNETQDLGTEADQSISAFFTSLVDTNQVDPTTPVLASPEPTRQENSSFFGELAQSETPVVESPKAQEETVVSDEREEVGFLSQLFASNPSSPNQADTEAMQSPEESKLAIQPSRVDLDRELPLLSIEVDHVPTPIIETPREDASEAVPDPEPSSPFNIISRFFSSPKSPKAKAEPTSLSSPKPKEAPKANEVTHVEETEEKGGSPFSFLGSLFSPRASPPPLEAAPSEPEKEEAAGFGSFLVSLVSGESAINEKESSKLGKLAEELLPSPTTVQAPLLSHTERVRKAVAFDKTDADEEVARLERIVPESKRLARLLIADKAETQLRLQEAEAAMRVLRQIRDQDTSISSKPKSALGSIKSSVQAAVPTKSGPVSAKASVDADIPTKSGTGSFKAASNSSVAGGPARGGVNEKDLKRATEAIAKLGKSVTVIPKERKPRASVAPHRAHYALAPVATSFSARINTFPSENDSHDTLQSAPISATSVYWQGVDEGRPDVFVTSVEVRDRTTRY